MFIQFPKENYYLLIFKHIGIVSHNYVIKKLQERICALKYKENYIDYLFKKREAISARLAWLLEEKIQLLEKKK